MEPVKNISADKQRQVTIEKDDGSGTRGSLTLDVEVVATIAGLAARNVTGIYSVGKSRWIAFGDSPTRGVEAEVGKIEAAFDLDVVMEYDVDVREVAKNLRAKISEEVQKMAGRRVVEININVVGIHLPSKSDEIREPETSRVR